MKSEPSSPPPHNSPAESPSPRAKPLAVPLPPKRKRLDEGRAPSLFRRFVGGTIVLAAWLCMLLMLAGASARLFYHDGTVPLIWFNAFTLYVYLPAYVVLLFAVWRKRRPLAMAAITIVACHLCWIVPDFVPAKREIADQSAKAPTRTVRIMFHNVYGAGREFDVVFNEIEETDPDVVVLTEFNLMWRKAAVQRGLHQRYRFNTLRQRFGHGFTFVFSKLLIRDHRQHPLAPGRLLLDLDIEVDETTFRLMCVHSPRPMLEGVGRLSQAYERFHVALEEQVVLANGPLVVIGDFNATQHARTYQQLTAGRLRSAHRDVGRGFAASWPNGKTWLPPIRIDHALVSPAIECLDVQEGIGRGSDHTPIILDFRVHPPAS